MSLNRYVFAAIAGTSMSVSAISASESGVSAGAVDPSDLEEITVYSLHAGGSALGGTTVTQADIQNFNRDTLDTAVLLASGATASSVGVRNETNVWIRGFDRWRVPLYQDGIPIYLPVDDRIDFGRFSTVDLSEIRISKGFASVIDGPGAMGGSINLVSRVVEKPLEGEARLGTVLDSTGSYQSWSSDLFVGSRQAQWFIQGAGSFTGQNHYRLSDDFTPGTFQGPGDRLDSQHQDYKINLKAGFTPDASAEYALNFIDQVGYKGNPVVDGIVPKSALNQVKYWTWPAWNKKSYYWLSKNELDDRGSYLKTRIYYDRFFNQLDSYDSIAYDTQNTPKSFNSTYDDRAAGTSVELSEALPGGIDVIRLAGHFRWDQHNETEGTRNAPFAPYYSQPWETAQETTSSAALENIYHPTGAWDLIAGLSYDYRHLIGDDQWVASGVKPPFGYSFSYPVANKQAWNGELAGVYRYSADGSVHVSYADRSRFPTLFEMYSTRFGTFVNNPDLRPERSHYAQAGVDDTRYGTHIVLNVFFARVVDGIVAVPLSPALSESENVGVERRYGYEVELSRQVLSSLQVGMNYSTLVRVTVAGGTVATDTPRQKFFAFMEWRPLRQLTIVPSVDIEGKRWLQSAVDNTLYYRGGSYSMLNVKAAYEFLPDATFELGTTNLGDRNYVIEDGYHAPGRQYFANLRFKF
ncbi:MAG: TonB-dependent receptor [Gammaproteobacteria bacterium]|nr:TonB-dependent receptor [Gammaproteobacteria bacterium]